MEKKEKLEGMEGIDIFREVKILSQIDHATLGLVKGRQVFAEFGLLGILIDCVMDLNGVIRVGCKFVSSIFRS